MTIKSRKLALLLALLLLILLAMPISAQQERPPDGELEHTVGLDQNVCGTASYLEVSAGTTVYHCYTITNTGDVALANHTLIDSEFGVLLQNDPTVLQPGDVLQHFEDEVVGETHTHESFWSASAPYVPPVVDDSGVTLVVEPTAVQLGTGPSAATSGSTLPLFALAGLGLLAAGAAWKRRTRE